MNNPKNKPNNQMSTTRNQAVRAQKRSQANAQRVANQYLNFDNTAYSKNNAVRRANFIDDSPKLKIIGLGGMDHGGSKNMILIEYMDDVLILDCGNDLGVKLPGINYAIPDVTYLESIKHKIKGYVITHGHLDHIGGLPHIVPKIPAPIYGSKFTIGRVEEIFENFGLSMPDGFELNTVILNENTHQKIKIGQFYVELIRITHSIPGSTCVVVDTPVGKIINTGDFRFDPKPLDHERSDIERLTEVGNEGVLALLSESTTTERLGRTPSESLVEPSFIQIMDKAPGRIFVAIFSTNVNRIQMIINAAVYHNKKIALDGRSMMSTLEMAVRHGFVKVPKGTFVPIASTTNLKDDQVVVVCTGGQGEPNSALQKMSSGEHAHIKMKEGDTVILSSTPIPETGNDALIGDMVDDLCRKKVHVFQHTTHELDNLGLLHVSGHASIDEYAEMIRITKPKFFIPIYGSYRSKERHLNIAIQEGISPKNMVNAENGQVILLSKDTISIAGEVTSGSVLIDQTGATVSGIVVKDRVLLSEEGLVVIILTIDKKTGQLLTSPDIISRGFIYIRDSEEIMNGLRSELKRATQQRYGRVDLDRFKAELKDHVTHYLFDQTKRSPIIIPVINIIGGKDVKNGQNNKTAEQIKLEQQKRFQEMRSRLLNQDARED